MDRHRKARFFFLLAAGVIVDLAAFLAFLLWFSDFLLRA